jgi:parvulin-like peptidyl-prolyl isomerase
VALESFTAASLRRLSRFGLLRPLIREEILANVVEAQQLPAQTRQLLLERFLEEHDLTNPSRQEQFLRQQILQPADLHFAAERGLVLENFIASEFMPKAGAHFLQRKGQLDRAIYSLLRIQDPYLARELHLQIAEAEADFAELAQRYAEGPERSTRGIVGPVPISQAHPDLAERLRVAREGELIEPFQVEQWWLVVRLEQRLEASFDPTTAHQMATELFETWLEKEVNRQMNALAEVLDHTPDSM